MVLDGFPDNGHAKAGAASSHDFFGEKGFKYSFALSLCIF